ncbi:hypothetical protein [Cytobacillus firmus]|uniref:hypothetical protein n=1 Tax=Cytobacillus firmus TaxID=1399 RepID=UPI0034A0F63A
MNDNAKQLKISLLYWGGRNIKIKTTLLENAYNFLNNSINFYHLATHEVYPQEYKRYWMFSIVDIVQAMELIFKEVLRRENEIFLYENIDNPKHTVSITKALHRIKNIINLELKVQDERIINQAIEIRNNIIHYEIELDINELFQIYMSIFSFLKSFHYRFLKTDLHDYIEEEFWEEEEELLLEKYNRNLLLHDEADSSKDYLLEVAESQLYMYYEIGDVEYKRIKYGEEESAFKSEFCGDCAIKKGYYHVFGCDLEVCPKCNGQAITCGCHDIRDFLV